MRGRVKFCPRCGRKTDNREINGTRRDICDSCDEIFYNNPLCAVAVVAEKDGKVLFIRRSVEPAKGMWALPGGFVEQGESVERAAMRELAEETGVKAKKAEVVSVVSVNSLFFGTLILMGVKVDALSGTLKAGDDASDVRWYEKGRMPAITFPAHKAFIKAAMKKREKNAHNS